MQTIRTRTKARTGDDGTVFRIAMLVRAINGKLNAAIAEELASSGLTMPQMLVVKAIAHSGPLTVSALAAELSVGKSTMVGIVDRLERAGLVERRRDEADRREVKVAFADSARDRIASFRTVLDSCFRHAFRNLEPEALAGVEASLEKLSEAMGFLDSNCAAPGSASREGD